MHKTVVLNVVGLTPALLGAVDARAVRAGRARPRVARITSAFPAVTCTAQSDYLTGRFPDAHGIVGNGWYAREDAEVRFWKQSNPLVQAPKIWETARAADPSFTCANLFWWFNMYSTADYSVTPRPMYPADGRKMPGRLHDAARAARRAPVDARDVSAVRVLGTARVDSIDAVDCRSGEGRGPAVQPDADARLPAASRLQPAARRARRSGRGRRPDAGRRRLRRSDSALRVARRAGHRALGVRAARRLLARPPQSRPARARAAGGPRRARPRDARSRRQRGVRGRRSSGGARLRQRPGEGARGPRPRSSRRPASKRSSTRPENARTTSIIPAPAI